MNRVLVLKLALPLFLFVLTFQGLTAPVLAQSGSSQFLGPLVYASKADSPFDLSELGTNFFLEDFEDSALNTPGVTASAGNVRSAALTPQFAGYTDSVDGDDGLKDGSGLGGHSFYSKYGVQGITFRFNDKILGSLPTEVGVVWTDGDGVTTFEAFDGQGDSLGKIGPVMIADSVYAGGTNDDNFFGMYHPEGIAGLRISNTEGGIEVDHLQYGKFAVDLESTGTNAVLDPISKRAMDSQSVIGQTTDCSPGEPCVYLYATQTRVLFVNPVLLNLSIVNSIAKPAMTAQLIMQVPSGWRLSGSGFNEACTGQCSAVYDVQPGGNRSIEITLQPNQAGDFDINARLDWFFGDDKTTIEGKNLSIPVSVEPLAAVTITPTPTSVSPPTKVAQPILAQENPGSGGCNIGLAKTRGAGLPDLTLLFLPVLGLVTLKRLQRP